MPLGDVVSALYPGFSKKRLQLTSSAWNFSPASPIAYLTELKSISSVEPSRVSIPLRVHQLRVELFSRCEKRRYSNRYFSPLPGTGSQELSIVITPFWTRIKHEQLLGMLAVCSWNFVVLESLKPHHSSSHDYSHQVNDLRRLNIRFAIHWDITRHFEIWSSMQWTRTQFLGVVLSTEPLTQRTLFSGRVVRYERILHSALKGFCIFYHKAKRFSRFNCPSTWLILVWLVKFLRIAINLCISWI